MDKTIIHASEHLVASYLGFLEVSVRNIWSIMNVIWTSKDSKKLDKLEGESEGLYFSINQVHIAIKVNVSSCGWMRRNAIRNELLELC